MANDRDANYDFLRFVGISCIILAHVHPAAIIFQIRNFDVPLMVLLSGMSFGHFTLSNYSNYHVFLLKRVLRLVVSTYFFLIIYNLTVYIVIAEVPNCIYILKQIFLIGSEDLGLWIVRILFFVSTLSPFLFRLNNAIKTNKILFGVLLFCWILYEIIVAISMSYFNPLLYKIINTFLYVEFGYIVIFFIGIRVSKMKSNHILLFAFILFLFYAAILATCFFRGGSCWTQPFKYPPTIYYVSYAVSISLFLIYLTFYTKIFDCLKHNNLVGFIGRWTLWIYLWQWLILKIYNEYQAYDNYVLGFLIVYSVSLIIVYMQSKFVFFALRFDFAIKYEKYLKLVFVG